MIKANHDWVATDHFFHMFVKSWFADAPSFNYWAAMVSAFVMSMVFGYRVLVCNPDVTFRKQEARKNHPDRDRQHAYSLPYYNHRFRNICTRYNWMLFDNDWDFNQYCPTGIRPNRSYSRRRTIFWNPLCWISHRYLEDDPLATTVSMHQMDKLYHNIGYKAIPGFEAPEED